MLVETAEGYYTFEIKMTEHVQPSDARHLITLDTFLDKPLLQAFVLSNDVTTSRLADKIMAMNANMFWDKMRVECGAVHRRGKPKRSKGDGAFGRVDKGSACHFKSGIG